jgi:hypothetical protein
MKIIFILHKITKMNTNEESIYKSNIKGLSKYRTSNELNRTKESHRSEFYLKKRSSEFRYSLLCPR